KVGSNQLPSPALKTLAGATFNSIARAYATGNDCQSQNYKPSFVLKRELLTGNRSDNFGFWILDFRLKRAIKSGASQVILDFGMLPGLAPKAG
ncbi:MAG: hypothetical protein ACYTXY_28040, partial [Nostoc sp.]